MSILGCGYFAQNIVNLIKVGGKTLLPGKLLPMFQLNAAEFSIIRTEVFQLQVGNKSFHLRRIHYAGEATESYSYLKCSDHLEATMYVRMCNLLQMRLLQRQW